MRERRRLAISLVLLSLLLPAAATEAATPDPTDDPSRVKLTDLRPRISRAARDLGQPYAAGCHVALEVTTPTRCLYGDRDGRTIVVVFGDSVVAQWWSAIQRAALHAGWRVVWMTKRSCPAADVTVLFDGRPYAACDTWRRDALAVIRELKQVDLVVMGSWSRNTLVSRTDDSTIPAGTPRASEWRAGYQRTVEALAGVALHVVILRDTPMLEADAPRCLRTHSGRTKPCSRDRTAALTARLWRAEQAVDGSYDWVRAIDMSARICKRKACWPVTADGVLRYRDDHHLTNTYARTLAPALASRLRSVIR
jgi:hypothetical protein